MLEIVDIVENKYKPNLDLIMEKAKKWHEYTACEQTPPSKMKK